MSTKPKVISIFTSCWLWRVSNTILRWCVVLPCSTKLILGSWTTKISQNVILLHRFPWYLQLNYMCYMYCRKIGSCVCKKLSLPVTHRKRALLHSLACWKLRHAFLLLSIPMYPRHLAILHLEMSLRKNSVLYINLFGASCRKWRWHDWYGYVFKLIYLLLNLINAVKSRFNWL